MRQVSIIIFLLTVGCTNQKTTTEQIVSDTVRQSSELTKIKPTDKHETQITLTDTSLNGHSVKFYQLTATIFDSLQRQTKQTEINLKSADSQIKKLDSCVVLKFQNQKIDSLCNMDDGEYFEKYLIKGLWEENKLLLVHFENWEESHDFFINLKDGSYYILTPFYEVNPKRDMILTYVDIAAAPIYSSELMISQIQKGVFKTLYKKDLGQTTITDAKWISNSDCLLTTGFVDIGTNDVKDKKWYRMTIE
ncbi:MAG: hypothetical protein KF845_00235 [Cyclobacteriaceae bacterium]|nr:hypothetical protein [Cyclobacteriaceae bacterium]